MEKAISKKIRKAFKYWYIPLFVGLIFVAVSIIAFTAPAFSLLVLAILFSLSFLLSGLSEIVFSIANKDQLDNWVWILAFGILSFVAGVFLLLNPSFTITTPALFIGIVILFHSIAAVSFALDIKKYGSRNWGWLLTFGVLGAILAFMLIWNPIFAGLSVVFFIALNFLFAGFLSIALSFQLKMLLKAHKELSEDINK